MNSKKDMDEEIERIVRSAFNTQKEEEKEKIPKGKYPKLDFHLGEMMKISDELGRADFKAHTVAMIGIVYKDSKKIYESLDTLKEIGAHEIIDLIHTKVKEMFNVDLSKGEKLNF